MSFIRRFLSDPGLATLVEIEAVNILDLEPPASITGVGSGKAQKYGKPFLDTWASSRTARSLSTR